MGARGGCAGSGGGGGGQGDRHTCWGGRGCTCWAAASPLDFTLFLLVSPPTSLPGPLLPSLVLLRDGHGCQSTFGALRPGHRLCWAGLLGALSEHVGRQGLLMTSLTQGPCWPHGRGQAPWAAWAAVPSVHACIQRHSEGQGTQRPVREEAPLRAGHCPELPRLPGKCWERVMTGSAGPRRASTPATAQLGPNRTEGTGQGPAGSHVDTPPRPQDRQMAPWNDTS